jgi:hypothetical protein
MAMPAIERYLNPRWPNRAKVAVAGLAVLALGGAFMSAAQYVTDEDVDTAAYETQIAQLTDQRDDLRAGADAVSADLAQREAELAGVSTELADVRLENTTMSAALTTANTRVQNLDERVVELQATNATVTAERDALAAMFPMTVDTSLAAADVAGTYAADWMLGYNSGLTDLALPSVRKVTIGRTEEGWLTVTIPGVVSAALTGTDGALFTVVDSTEAVSPVGGVARVARLAISVYAGATVTAADGTTTITELGLSIAISTPAVGSAPAGVALYGADLVPIS